MSFYIKKSGNSISIERKSVLAQQQQEHLTAVVTFLFLQVQQGKLNQLCQRNYCTTFKCCSQNHILIIIIHVVCKHIISTTQTHANLPRITSALQISGNMIKIGPATNTAECRNQNSIKASQRYTFVHNHILAYSRVWVPCNSILSLFPV